MVLTNTNTNTNIIFETINSLEQYRFVTEYYYLNKFIYMKILSCYKFEKILQLKYSLR